MGDESWIPRFEKRDDVYVVHYRGDEWWPVNEIREEYDPGKWCEGYPYPRVRLSFEMVLPPSSRDLSIPDNIILGDN